MAQFTRIEVFNKMKETGMVPLFYHSDLEVCRKVMQACYNGGARLLEFTARGDFAHVLFGELNQYAIKKLPGLMMGVGSITDAAAASLYLQMGANFIVTPSLREDIAVVCNRRKVLWSPGCGSLGEINRAEELGCELVKLFPGATYGAGFVKAIKGPQPWTNIMPTGGVDLEEANLTSWFSAGVTCVGLGSKLIDKATMENGEYASLEQKVKDTLARIKKIRTS